MAFNGATTPALSEAQVEQLFELRRRRAALTAEINRILGSVAQVDRPSWHCERCGHTWKGMWRNRKPRHCSKCHAANWDRPSPNKAKVNGNATPAPWERPSGLTPPPPPVPIPDIAPYPTMFVEVDRPPQPERTIEQLLNQVTMEHAADEIGPATLGENVAEQIEATQEKARDIAIDTLMQEPQSCTAHRFIDGVCLFCGDSQPQEAT